MNVLILSTYDTFGGAAKAAYRLHQGLKKTEVNSQMMVQVKHTDDSTVLGLPVTSGKAQAIGGARISLDVLPLKIYGKSTPVSYSLQWLPNNTVSRANNIAPDLINLHWIHHGYLTIKDLTRLEKPIVWTLHDMWAFTGGCHYTQECNKYNSSCGACPQLNNSKNWDLSRWVWKQKEKAWKNLDLTIVTPSHWLAECASSSSLLKDKHIKVIPNGIDTEEYRPIDKQIARNILGLSQDKKLILFGALEAGGDRRKGFHLLQPALQELSQSKWQDRIELVVFGSSGSKNSPDFGFPVRYLNTLNDSFSLSLVYSAADVFVQPSLQDNLPNTLLEAIACATPCVGFKIGGIPDVIEHQQNGYLAQPYQTNDFARGIAWVLEDEERYQKLSNRARERAEKNFNLKIQADRYHSLFVEILSQNTSIDSKDFASVY